MGARHRPAHQRNVYFCSSPGSDLLLAGGLELAAGWPVTYRLDTACLANWAKMQEKFAPGSGGADLLYAGEFPPHAQNATVALKSVPHLDLLAPNPSPEKHILSFPPEPFDQVVS